MMDDGWHFVGSGGGDDWLVGETLCCVSDFHLIVGRKVPTYSVRYLERLITLFARAVLPQPLRTSDAYSRWRMQLF